MILSVLAANAGTVPADDVRLWLRSRGSQEVRALASSASTFRDLAARSERYLAGYTPEVVRERTARKLCAALTYGLPAPEAALITLVALDMLDSGRDGTLLTKAFSVAMRSTQASVLNRADSLRSRGLLRISARRVGVPTRVRLKTAPAAAQSDALDALADDLGAGTDSTLVDLLRAVRSSVLSYGDLGYDCWYIALLDALGIRRDVVTPSRASRAKRRMLDLAGTDGFMTALRTLDTPEVRELHAAAEDERRAAATVRAQSAEDARRAKRAGWDWLESIVPLPRKDVSAAALDEWIAQTREGVHALDPIVIRYAADALARTLRKRTWSDARSAHVLDSLFPERGILRYVGAHGRVPSSQDELVAWVRNVRQSVRTADIVALRRAVALAGHSRKLAVRAFPDERLHAFYAERGALPAGSDDAAVIAWVRADGPRVSADAAPTLRDEMESAGWSAGYVAHAVPRLTEEVAA